MPDSCKGISTFVKSDGTVVIIGSSPGYEWLYDYYNNLTYDYYDEQVESPS